MVEADAAEAQLSELRNEIEGLVLEARGRRGRKHGELIDGSKLEPLLEARYTCHGYTYTYYGYTYTHYGYTYYGYTYYGHTAHLVRMVGQVPGR